MLKRRHFLKLSAAAGLSMCVHVPKANGTNGHHDGPFVAVFNASGGWDTTYLMDPKGVPEINRLYGVDQIDTEGAISFAPTMGALPELGMTNRQFFERYGPELLVVNGIDVSVNNHSPCSRYVATGELSSLVYPTFPALVAAAKCPDVPLAFLTFGQYSATGNLVAQTRIPYLNSLDGFGNIGYANSLRTRRFQHQRVSERIEAALLDAQQSTHPLPRVSQARTFVRNAQQSSKALDRVAPHMPVDRPQNIFRQQIEIALTGFASGLAVSANLKLGSFDSHNTNDEDQMNLIPEFLAGIDYMMRRAEEIGIRDRLIVIIQSEMGRTPWYNGTGGKDHWSITSMMAMGPGIGGNRVVGQTTINPDSGFDQTAAVLDPNTLQMRPDGIHIRPEHIQQAQRTLLGIADHPLSARFKLDLPAEEHLINLFSGP
jgi:uncharacterized protein (DUF1501 family)